MLPLFLAFGLQGTGLQLPSIFSNNMVLQRERPITFFGTGRVGQSVSATIGGKEGSTTVRPDGTWTIKLDALPAGGPYKAVVTSDRTLTYDNVLVGEVWVASGQSNMEWPQAAADDFALAQRETDPWVRMFTVPHVSKDEPQRDFGGTWEMSTPTTVGRFSAVGNSFAKQIQKALGVPVGIIHTSWGGTPAESWTSREALLASKNLAPMVNNYLRDLRDFPAKRAAYEKALAEWNAKVYHQDPGNRGFTAGWANEILDTSDWKRVTLPSTIESQFGAMDGAVWYRKTLVVPPAVAEQDTVLELGAIDDFDTVYINGRQVGATTDATPNWYMVPRSYKIPRNTFRAGGNTIAVRVYDTTATGGFTGAASQMQLKRSDQGTSMDLSGEWWSKVEVRFEPPTQDILRQQPQEPFGPGNPWVPSGLYNAMIAPIIQYPIRGAIWYQGESNAGRAYQYRELFPTMIQDWRRRWGQGNFPFYFVQLANFTARNEQPVESDWAELREAQSMTLGLRNTGQAVTIDIGEAGDIHPRNKREVGRRLALSALAQTYGIKVAHSGPVYDRSSVDGRSMRIRFRHSYGLRTSDGGPVVGFAIAGADRKFVWANARIEGDQVVVSAPGVAAPVAVRYGWSNNPAVNLVNGAGLPASPFRTDSWPGITQPK